MTCTSPTRRFQRTPARNGCSGDEHLGLVVRAHAGRSTSASRSSPRPTKPPAKSWTSITLGDEPGSCPRHDDAAHIQQRPRCVGCAATLGTSPVTGPLRSVNGHAGHSRPVEAADCRASATQIVAESRYQGSEVGDRSITSHSPDGVAESIVFGDVPPGVIDRVVDAHTTIQRPRR